MSSLLLEMKDIHKKFPGVYALNGVHFELKAGEVHALLGENGAGKSTLIKVLGGIYSKSQGEILIEGKPVQIDNVAHARSEGISIIHQELVLVPHLSVAENIFLGQEPRGKSGLVDFESMKQKTEKVLHDFGLNFSPDTPIINLTIAQQQMVEIAKAISFQAKIIVMDEPTSSLADKEVDALFESIHQLTRKGIGVIYISHRMSELQQIADRVTVLRDGEYVGTYVVAETSNDKLISMMVGRNVTNYYTRTFNNCTETILKVEGLSSEKVRDLTFELKKGEILGFAGLMGAGRSEAMKVLFGIDKMTSGTVELEGKRIHIKSVKQMISKGIALVPEDRKNEAIFPVQSVQFNLTLKILKEFIKAISVNIAKEQSITKKFMNQLSIKAASEFVSLGSLSGGNQQKVVISSWLSTNPKVLILDEPTRGIDVGNKREIYVIMNELVRQGVSIIMVSSELPEILNMSDRIAVMCGGTITKILDRTDASQEKIMQYAVKM